LEVINIQQSNNVIIYASHKAVTCSTSPQWCQCIINKSPGGHADQMALNVNVPW